MTERKVFAREMLVDGEMKKVKLTQKDLFNEILDKVADDELLTEFVNYQLDMLARKSANRTTKKESAEDIALMDKIVGILTDEPISTSEIVGYFAKEGVIYTPQKITAIMKKVVTEGRAEKLIDKRVGKFIRVKKG